MSNVSGLSRSTHPMTLAGADTHNAPEINSFFANEQNRHEFYSPFELAPLYPPQETPEINIFFANEQNYDDFNSPFELALPSSPSQKIPVIPESSQSRTRRILLELRDSFFAQEAPLPPRKRARVTTINSSEETKGKKYSHKDSRLIEKIIELSEAKIWDDAVEEWDIVGSTYLNNGEESDTCHCGHYPIRQIFHIENTTNHNTADIGNVCIKLFQGFKGRTQIFKGIKEIEKNNEIKAPQALIKFAYQQSILDENEKAFYLSQRKKQGRLIRVGDKERMIRLNNIILLALSYSNKKVFQMLDENPQNTASPKLLHLAQRLKIITERDSNYYLKIWKNSELDPFERSEKTLINQKILSSDDLRNNLLRADNRQT